MCWAEDWRAHAMQEVLSAGGPTYAMKWRAGRTAGAAGGPAGRPSKNQCSKQWRAQTWPGEPSDQIKSVEGRPPSKKQ